MKPLSSLRASVGRLVLVGIALLGCTGSAFAGAGVTIDGNLQDMIDYAGTISVPANGCAFVDQDPARDIRIFDPKIHPCVPIADNYYVNGFDQVLDVLAYDRTQQTLYLGIRTAGLIGDPDGNGNPDTRCPEATFDDQPGVGFDDSYRWDINADCVGAPEIAIELRDNTLTVTGATFSTKTYAFNGTDLEVAVEGIVLPPAYDVQVFAGNISDGLGEDLHLLQCAPTGPQIVVDKTANPELICPGANTTFTIVVTNPGSVPLQTVNLTDALPAGLTYVNGSSNSNCGVGQPNVNGQNLTWPAFTIAPGASCTITFQATAGAECFGPQVNSATAVGSFSTACFQGGEPQTVQDSDDATVTCAAPPCVNITAVDAPASACANAAVVISGTVQNCSAESETIVVTLNGGAPQNLGTVAAGASANFSFNTTMGACTPGQNVAFTVVATATNECGQATDTEVRNVLCQSPPCVNITLVNAPAQACANAEITVSGTVQNCGTDAATIVVTLNGGAPQNLGSVAGGATANFSFNTTMGACTAGQNVAFSVVATATNDCGQATDTEVRNVLCQAPPCVNITALNGPGQACANAAVTISGTVQNCGTDPETITVTLNGGAPQNLGTVAGGASANFSFNTTMGDCIGGQNVPFVVVATATNDCGQATDTETENVLCQAPPCVNITLVNAPASACANASITISGTVQNCGTDAETIVVTLNGGAPQNLGTVAGGASANFSFNTTMGACTAGQNVAFTVVATATNDCGQATDTEVRNVLCQAPPCVNITAVNGPDQACANAAVTISGTVQNCGADPATIVVTLNGGAPQNLGNVAGGASANFSFSTTMGACAAGQNVPFSVVATATNDCGQATDTEVRNVLCQSPPCVNITAVNGPTQACANAQVTISGTVQNCGADAATISVTLNGGAPQNLGSVAGGASANFSFQTTMGACTAGQNVPFVVVATATNDCGQATDTETENVLCQAPPCVNITVVNAPASACANTSVTISGTVQNCGTDSETIVVVLNGGASQNLGTVAAGASANFSFQTTMGNCAAGQNVAFTVVATATNDCGQATDTETRNVACGIGPCVEVSLEAPDQSCVGEQVEVTASVTNCSTASETISVNVSGQTHNYGTVGPGQTVSHVFVFTVQNCVDGGVNYSATATATNECGTATDTDSERVACQIPVIDVEKTAESSVANGATIHYVITVTNPGPVALENVVVTDALCPYARYADSAVPAPFSEPAVGSGGSVVWHIANLAVNQSVQLSFNATADVLFGGGTCPAEVTCNNHVVATGFCAGTGTSGTPARDEDTFPTTIICTADNCPRTVGYWGAQCAQRGNGSTKYTVAQLTRIAECIDDRMSYFNWSAGTDFERFCALINPSKPMTSQKQALRQLAGTLANLCVDALDIEASQGGVVKLDPNTPISCDGFEADTIGELIDEVDDLLASGDTGAFNRMISCFDGINNGTNIPTNCDDSNDSELGNDFGSSGVWTSETIGRAVPNPFVASMRFSYEVPAGDAQDVEIGIYNVAGRLITRLTSEVQGPGEYTVDWDGRDASGVQMAPGVYFLKAKVGQAESTSRLLKIDR